MALITLGLLAAGAFFGWRFIRNEILPGIDEATEVFTPLSDSPPGPCFDLEIDNGAVSGWDEVPCEGDHQVEVAFAALFEEGPFPGDEYLTVTASRTCRDAFEAYVGISPEASMYDVDWLIPSEGNWNSGVRKGICLVVTEDGSTLTRAVKGSSS